MSDPLRPRTSLRPPQGQAVPRVSFGPVFDVEKALSGRSDTREQQLRDEQAANESAALDQAEVRRRETLRMEEKQRDEAQKQQAEQAKLQAAIRDEETERVARELGYSTRRTATGEKEVLWPTEDEQKAAQAKLEEGALKARQAQESERAAAEKAARDARSADLRWSRDDAEERLNEITEELDVVKATAGIKNEAIVDDDYWLDDQGELRAQYETLSKQRDALQSEFKAAHKAFRLSTKPTASPSMGELVAQNREVEDQTKAFNARMEQFNTKAGEWQQGNAAKAQAMEEEYQALLRRGLSPQQLSAAREEYRLKQLHFVGEQEKARRALDAEAADLKAEEQMIRQRKSKAFETRAVLAQEAEPYRDPKDIREGLAKSPAKGVAPGSTAKPVVGVAAKLDEHQSIAREQIESQIADLENRFGEGKITREQLVAGVDSIAVGLDLDDDTKQRIENEFLTVAEKAVASAGSGDPEAVAKSPAWQELDPVAERLGYKSGAEMFRASGYYRQGGAGGVKIPSKEAEGVAKRLTGLLSVLGEEKAKGMQTGMPGGTQQAAIRSIEQEARSVTSMDQADEVLAHMARFIEENPDQFRAERGEGDGVAGWWQEVGAKLLQSAADTTADLGRGAVNPFRDTEGKAQDYLKRGMRDLLRGGRNRYWEGVNADGETVRTMKVGSRAEAAEKLGVDKDTIKDVRGEVWGVSPLTKTTTAGFWNDAATVVADSLPIMATFPFGPAGFVVGSTSMGQTYLDEANKREDFRALAEYKKLGLAAAVGTVRMAVERTLGVFGRNVPGLGGGIANRMLARVTSKWLSIPTRVGIDYIGENFEEVLQEVTPFVFEGIGNAIGVTPLEQSATWDRFSSHMAEFARAFPEMQPGMLVLSAFGVPSSIAAHRKAPEMAKVLDDQMSVEMMVAMGANPRLLARAVAATSPVTRVELMQLAMRKAKPDSPEAKAKLVEIAERLAQTPDGRIRTSMIEFGQQVQPEALAAATGLAQAEIEAASEMFGPPEMGAEGAIALAAASQTVEHVLPGTYKAFMAKAVVAAQERAKKNVEAMREVSTEQDLLEYESAVEAANAGLVAPDQDPAVIAISNRIIDKQIASGLGKVLNGAADKLTELELDAIARKSGENAKRRMEPLTEMVGEFGNILVTEAGMAHLNAQSDTGAPRFPAVAALSTMSVSEARKWLQNKDAEFRRMAAEADLSSGGDTATQGGVSPSAAPSGVAEEPSPLAGQSFAAKEAMSNLDAEIKRLESKKIPKSKAQGNLLRSLRAEVGKYQRLFPNVRFAAPPDPDADGNVRSSAGVEVSLATGELIIDLDALAKTAEARPNMPQIIAAAIREEALHVASVDELSLRAVKRALPREDGESETDFDDRVSKEWAKLSSRRRVELAKQESARLWDSTPGPMRQLVIKAYRSGPLGKLDAESKSEADAMKALPAMEPWQLGSEMIRMIAQGQLPGEAITEAVMVSDASVTVQQTWFAEIVDLLRNLAKRIKEVLKEVGNIDPLLRNELVSVAKSLNERLKDAENAGTFTQNIAPTLDKAGMKPRDIYSVFQALNISPRTAAGRAFTGLPADATADDALGAFAGAWASASDKAARKVLGRAIGAFLPEASPQGRRAALGAITEALGSAQPNQQQDLADALGVIAKLDKNKKKNVAEIARAWLRGDTLGTAEPVAVDRGRQTSDGFFRSVAGELDGDVQQAALDLRSETDLLDQLEDSGTMLMLHSDMVSPDPVPEGRSVFLGRNYAGNPVVFVDPATTRPNSVMGDFRSAVYESGLTRRNVTNSPNPVAQPPIVREVPSWTRNLRVESTTPATSRRGNGDPGRQTPGATSSSPTASTQPQSMLSLIGNLPNGTATASEFRSAVDSGNVGQVARILSDAAARVRESGGDAEAFGIQSLLALHSMVSASSPVGADRIEHQDSLADLTRAQADTASAAMRFLVNVMDERMLPPDVFVTFTTERAPFSGPVRITRNLRGPLLEISPDATPGDIVAAMARLAPDAVRAEAREHLIDFLGGVAVVDAYYDHPGKTTGNLTPIRDEADIEAMLDLQREFGRTIEFGVVVRTGNGRTVHIPLKGLPGLRGIISGQGAAALRRSDLDAILDHQVADFVNRPLSAWNDYGDLQAPAHRVFTHFARRDAELAASEEPAPEPDDIDIDAVAERIPPLETYMRDGNQQTVAREMETERSPTEARDRMQEVVSLHEANSGPTPDLPFSPGPRPTFSERFDGIVTRAGQNSQGGQIEGAATENDIALMRQALGALDDAITEVRDNIDRIDAERAEALDTLANADNAVSPLRIDSIIRRLDETVGAVPAAKVDAMLKADDALDNGDRMGFAAAVAELQAAGVNVSGVTEALATLAKARKKADKEAARKAARDAYAEATGSLRAETELQVEIRGMIRRGDLHGARELLVGRRFAGRGVAPVVDAITSAMKVQPTPGSVAVRKFAADAINTVADRARAHQAQVLLDLERIGTTVEDTFRSDLFAAGELFAALQAARNANVMLRVGTSQEARDQGVQTGVLATIQRNLALFADGLADIIERGETRQTVQSNAAMQGPVMGELAALVMRMQSSSRSTSATLTRQQETAIGGILAVAVPQVARRHGQRYHTDDVNDVARAEAEAGAVEVARRFLATVSGTSLDGTVPTQPVQTPAMSVQAELQSTDPDVREDLRAGFESLAESHAELAAMQIDLRARRDAVIRQIREHLKAIPYASSEAVDTAIAETEEQFRMVLDQADEMLARKLREIQGSAATANGMMVEDAGGMRADPLTKFPAGLSSKRLEAVRNRLETAASKAQINPVEMAQAESRRDALARGVASFVKAEAATAKADVRALAEGTQALQSWIVSTGERKVARAGDPATARTTARQQREIEPAMRRRPAILREGGTPTRQQPEGRPAYVPAPTIVDPEALRVTRNAGMPDAVAVLLGGDSGSDLLIPALAKVAKSADPMVRRQELIAEIIAWAQRNPVAADLLPRTLAVNGINLRGVFDSVPAIETAEEAESPAWRAAYDKLAQPEADPRTSEQRIEDAKREALEELEAAQAARENRPKRPVDPRTFDQRVAEMQSRPDPAYRAEADKAKAKAERAAKVESAKQAAKKLLRNMIPRVGETYPEFMARFLARRAADIKAGRQFKSDMTAEELGEILDKEWILKEGLDGKRRIKEAPNPDDSILRSAEPVAVVSAGNSPNFGVNSPLAPHLINGKTNILDAAESAGRPEGRSGEAWFSLSGGSLEGIRSGATAGKSWASLAQKGSRGQEDALAKTATEQGWFITDDPFGDLDVHTDTGEHTVAYSERHGRWIKATGPGEFGIWPSIGSASFGETTDYWVENRTATPAEYLIRLALAKNVYGEDIQVEAIWWREGRVSIVTSHAHAPGVHPDPTQLDGKVREFGPGWVLLDGISMGQPYTRAYVDVDNQLVIGDVKEDNFIINDNAPTRMIDGIIVPVWGPMQDLVRKIAGDDAVRDDSTLRSAEPVDVTPGGVSRRDFLRRTGGAALAMLAPQIESAKTIADLAKLIPDTLAPAEAMMAKMALRGRRMQDFEAWAEKNGDPDLFEVFAELAKAFPEIRALVDRAAELEPKLFATLEGAGVDWLIAPGEREAFKEAIRVTLKGVPVPVGDVNEGVEASNRGATGQESPVDARSGLSEADYARHAELEAKHDAGTITDEERAEAEGIVERAARAAGLVMAWRAVGGDVGRQNHSGGIYATSNRNVAEFFAGTSGEVKRIALDLGLRPMEVRESIEEDAYDSLKDFRDAEADFQDSEFTTIVGRDLPDGPERSDVFVLRATSQIKSAEPFTGVPLAERFDPGSDSILRMAEPIDINAEPAPENEPNSTPEGRLTKKRTLSPEQIAKMQRGRAIARLARRMQGMDAELMEYDAPSPVAWAEEYRKARQVAMETGKIPGDPRRSNPVGFTDGRIAHELAVKAYRDNFQPETVEGWNAAADKMWEENKANPERLADRLLKKVMVDGLSLDAEEMMLAAKMVSHLHSRAIYLGNEEDMDRARRFSWMFEKTGTQLARAMRARTDQFLTKAQRNAMYLSKFATQLDPGEQADIEAEPDSRKRNEKLRKAQEMAYQRLQVVLNTMGMDLDDIHTAKAADGFRKSRALGDLITKVAKTPDEALAIKMKIDGHADKAVRKETGLTDKNLRALKKRFHDALTNLVLDLVESGRTFASFDPDFSSLGMASPIAAFEQQRAVDMAERIARLKVKQRVQFNKMMRAANVQDARLNANNQIAWLPMAPGGLSGLGQHRFDINNAVQAAYIARMIQAVKGNRFDMDSELWRAMILGGLMTQSVNVQGSGINIALEYGMQRPFEAAWNSFLGMFGASDPNVITLRTFAREYRYLLRGMKANFRNAWTRAVQAFQSEYTVFEDEHLGREMQVGDIVERGGGMVFISEHALIQALGPRAYETAAKWRLRALQQGATPEEANDIARTQLEKSPVWRVQSAIHSLFEGANLGWLDPTKGKTIRYSFRLLGLMDTFFKELIFGGEVAAQAYRLGLQQLTEQGMAQGLKGKALYQFVQQGQDQMTAYGSTQMPWMEAFIKAQTDTPGSEAAIRAVEKAQELTFTKELREGSEGAGAVEALATTIVKERGKKRYTLEGNIWRMFLVKFLPFVSTPFQVYSAGLRRTPFGLLSVLPRLIGSGMYRLTGKGAFFDSYPKALLVRDLADQSISAVLFTVLYGMTEGDDDDDKKGMLITGSHGYGTESEGVRQLALRTDGATMIRIGDRENPIHRFDYSRYDPLSTTFAALVDLIRSAKRTRDGAPKQQEFMKIASFVRDRIQSQPMLQNLATMNEVLSFAFAADFDQSGYAAQRFMRSMVGGYSPNLMKQAMRNLDPYMRDDKNMPLHKKLLYDVFPAADLIGVPKKIDFYGNPVTKQVPPVVGRIGRLVADTATQPSSEEDHVFDEFLQQYLMVYYYPTPGLPFPASLRRDKYLDPDNPKADTRGYVDMTPEELETYRMVTGEQLSKELRRLIKPRDLARPTEETLAEAKKIITQVQSDTMARMFASHRRWADATPSEREARAERAKKRQG